MSIGNEVSRSAPIPRGYELFPPRWAYPHLTDKQYAAAKEQHYAKLGISAPKKKPKDK